MLRTSTSAITNRLGTSSPAAAAPASASAQQQAAVIPQPPQTVLFQPRISEQQLRAIRSEQYANYLNFSFAQIEHLKNQYPADAALYIQRLLSEDSIYRFKELIPNEDVAARDRLIALFPLERDTIIARHETQPYVRPECVIS